MSQLSRFRALVYCGYSEGMGYSAIDELRDIKSDTSVLSSFAVEQREHNQWMKEHQIKMDEHNLHLEKILEKLSEK